MLRLITPLLFALAACTHQQTPAARTCSVLNTETQLDACAGKPVTIRGTVAGRSIIGVEVDVAPDLAGKTAHAFGTLEKSGTQWALKTNGALAKAHATN